MKETFTRDENNPGAVLNTDHQGLKAYRMRKQKSKEIDNLKEEVNDIKKMLGLILEKIK